MTVPCGWHREQCHTCSGTGKAWRITGPTVLPSFGTFALTAVPTDALCYNCRGSGYVMAKVVGDGEYL